MDGRFNDEFVHVHAGVYLCLVSQPCQPVCQQNTKTRPALIQLVCCLSNVFSTAALWKWVVRGQKHKEERSNSRDKLTLVYT